MNFPLTSPCKSVGKDARWGVGTRANRGQEAGPQVGGKSFKRVGSEKRVKGRKPRK